MNSNFVIIDIHLKITHKALESILSWINYVGFVGYITKGHPSLLITFIHFNLPHKSTHMSFIISDNTPHGLFDTYINK